MKLADKKVILKNYESLLAKYGDDPRSCQWKDRASQNLRFDVLEEVADLNGARVLDLGCGTADFFYHLKKKDISANYTGYDLSPAMVNFIKQKNPSCRVFVRDILKEGVAETFDYCLISGIFNNKISNNWRFLTAVLETLWPHIRKGIAFNLITSYVDYRESHLYYADPCKIYNWIKLHLTRFITLRSDYLPFEYTVYAYKKNQ